MGRGLGIFELVADARKLDPAAFESKYGPYFLIRTLDDGTLDPMEGELSTTIVSMRDMSRQSSRLMNPEASYVYPLVPRAEGEAVLVGRADSCDIQIDDRSVSKEHAQLFVRSDGSLAIIDKRSKNGTRVGTLSLEAGMPTAVQFGKTITFGSVRVTYLPVRQLIDFIRATFDAAEDDPELAFDIDVEFDDGG